MTNAALQHIAKGAHARETGARGLEAELLSVIEQAAYDTFAQARDARVVINVRGGELRCEVKRSA